MYEICSVLCIMLCNVVLFHPMNVFVYVQIDCESPCEMNARSKVILLRNQVSDGIIHKARSMTPDVWTRTILAYHGTINWFYGALNIDYAKYRGI
jgi:hypothetical protein